MVRQMMIRMGCKFNTVQLRGKPNKILHKTDCHCEGAWATEESHQFPDETLRCAQSDRQKNCVLNTLSLDSITPFVGLTKPYWLQIANCKLSIPYLFCLLVVWAFFLGASDPGASLRGYGWKKLAPNLLVYRKFLRSVRHVAGGCDC